MVLRSRSLGREVRPRLTTAHNTTMRSVGIYRFLAALQTEGVVAGLGWNWGALQGHPRLPRVRFKRVVLSPALWNASGDEIRAFAGSRGADGFRRVQEWRADQGLPRFVGLVDADNVLPVDLDNVLSVESFVDVVKNRPGIALRELLMDEKRHVVQGPEGAFLNEVVIPFVRRARSSASRTSQTSRASQTSRTLQASRPSQTSQTLQTSGTSPDAQSPESRVAPAARVESNGVEPVRRAFEPGSEWLYAKLYTGPAMADEVLQRAVRPVAAQAISEGVAQQWFFIRYGDPEWHLRIRFRGPPEQLLSQVLPALRQACDPFLEDRRVWRMQLDTYEREMSRYGGDRGIELCERVFQADSEAVAEILGRLAGDEGADARWRVALKGMDLLLEDFGFDLEGKYAVLARTAESFEREFLVAGSFKKQVMDRFRTERRPTMDLLSPDHEESHPLQPEFEILHRRSEEAGPLLAQLRSRAEAGELSCEPADLAMSLLHMHANRLFRSAARAQEMLIYRFLERSYDSQLARLGKKRRDRVGVPVPA